jgi:hypothetical protein
VRHQMRLSGQVVTTRSEVIHQHSRSVALSGACALHTDRGELLVGADADRHDRLDLFIHSFIYVIRVVLVSVLVHKHTYHTHTHEQ